LVFAGLVACGVFSLCTTAMIVSTLAIESYQFFRMPEASVWEFFTDLRWQPLLGAQKHFGIWPLVGGTVMISLVAMVFALPLGLITAIYLSEYAHPTVRAILKPVLEVIAGIPTVVFGFFALTVITPGLQWLHGGFDVYNVMSAGIAVGIMCLPIVTSLSEDALRAVPRSLREGAYGLGATRFEVSVHVVTPAALSGIIAAFLLAIARAVGETMIVALAAGSTPMPLADNPAAALDPRNPAQTMTGYMVMIFLGDVSNFGPEYYSSYAVAGMLFMMTLMLTLIGHGIRVKFRQAYE
jgi:phosphate transport system permease protein